MENDEKKLDEYVEDKILRITFRAKNFTREEMDIVDDYCRVVYDNNRKLMILDLIRYKEENLPIQLLDNKINLIYDEINNRLMKVEGVPTESKDTKKSMWKGFNKPINTN